MIESVGLLQVSVERPDMIESVGLLQVSVERPDMNESWFAAGVC